MDHGIAQVAYREDGKSGAAFVCSLMSDCGLGRLGCDGEDCVVSSESHGAFVVGHEACACETPTRGAASRPLANGERGACVPVMRTRKWLRKRRKKRRWAVGALQGLEYRLCAERLLWFGE